MKRLNKKLATILMAGVCVASLAVATANVVSSADDATATTYAISDVFTSNGVLTSQKVASTDAAETVAFELANGEYARMKRDLAYTWYDAKDSQKFLSMKFSFKELNFETITFEMESAASIATENEKIYNAVEFKVESGALKVAVINEGMADADKVYHDVASKDNIVLSFAKEAGFGDKFGEFGVKINDVNVGVFTNIGANFGDYTYEKIHPLEIVAKAAEGAKATVYMQEINGQKFDNVADAKVTDTAAPVLVVNEELKTFQLGTAFSLAYEKVDVLQSSSLTETKKYYQYNPADKLNDENKIDYDATLTTSVYFMDTVYYKKVEPTETLISATAKEGYVATSVKKESGGKEYVSIQITLEDSSNNKSEIDLAWYAETTEQPTAIGGATADKADYIVIDKNDVGPWYKLVTAKSDGTNEKSADYDAQVADYEEALAKNAEDVYAGSNSSITLPAVDWLMDDDGGYRGLRFTISYKTPESSDTKTASSLSYNGLKISTSEEGLYEFKIFATDKSGNVMEYYDEDGELVEVTTSNVWDIDEIPSFKFTIANRGIKVEEPTKSSDKMVEKILDQTYTLSGLKVIGASNEQSKYALYRFDDSDYSGSNVTGALASVKYEDIRPTVEQLNKVGTDYNSYFDLYLELYAAKLAESVTDGDKDAIKACFKEIKAYNSNITEEDPEWEEYNKYNWNATSASFSTVAEGEYLLLADYWEDGVFGVRAAAYKVVVVESTADVIEGDSKFSAWVKNNVVSVVLFGVAGLMLIAIIILLLVKPSDETLEDIDKEAKKKGQTDSEENQEETK